MEKFTQSSPLAVDVLVRNEHDPYLYFLDISKGLRDFGLTRGEKVRNRACGCTSVARLLLQSSFLCQVMRPFYRLTRGEKVRNRACGCTSVARLLLQSSFLCQVMRNVRHDCGSQQTHVWLFGRALWQQIGFHKHCTMITDCRRSCWVYVSGVSA
jgi:hypothetical protein